MRPSEQKLELETFVFGGTGSCPHPLVDKIRLGDFRDLGIRIRVDIFLRLFVFLVILLFLVLFLLTITFTIKVLSFCETLNLPFDAFVKINYSDRNLSKILSWLDNLDIFAVLNM